MKRELDNIDKHLLALLKINGELGQLQHRLFESLLNLFNLKRNDFDIKIDEDKTATFIIKKKILDKFNRRDKKLLNDVYLKFYKDGLVIEKRANKVNEKYKDA